MVWWKKGQVGYEIVIMQFWHLQLENKRPEAERECKQQKLKWYKSNFQEKKVKKPCKKEH